MSYHFLTQIVLLLELKCVVKTEDILFESDDFPRRNEELFVVTGPSGEVRIQLPRYSLSSFVEKRIEHVLHAILTDRHLFGIVDRFAVRIHVDTHAHPVPHPIDLRIIFSDQVIGRPEYNTIDNVLKKINQYILIMKDRTCDHLQVDNKGILTS